MKTINRHVSIVVLAAYSFGFDIPALPNAEFHDAEVSTNFTFAVGAVANRKLVFSLELQATPSNNVEVAIGCDAAGVWRCERECHHQSYRNGFWPDDKIGADFGIIPCIKGC